MRALLLFYYFPPSGGPGVQRGLELCRHLPPYGVEPALVTVDPRAFTGGESYAADPSLQDVVPKGLRITRSATGDRVLLRKILARTRTLRFAQELAPAWFFERQAGWLRPALEACEREIEQFRPDVLLTSSQPYVAHLVGRELKRRTGLPWVADFRDPWTLSWGRTFVSERAYRWEDEREREVLAAADVVVMNTPGSRRELLAARPWLAPSRVVVVRNGYDAADFDAAAAGPGVARDPDRVLVVHAGSFRAPAAGRRRGGLRAWLDAREYRPLPYDLGSHSPEPLLGALARLAATPGAAPVSVRLVGTLDRTWTARARELGVADRLEVLGYRPHAETLAHLLAADLLYLPTITRSDGGPVSNVPAKTYEYLGSGRPMVVLAGPGDVRETVAGRERVTLLEPGDVEGLAARIAASRPGSGGPPRPDPGDAQPHRRAEVARLMSEALRQARDTALR